MAISGILPPPLRTDVAFIGSFPTGEDKSAFTNHGLSVRECSEADFDTKIDPSLTTAVVFTQSAQSLSAVTTWLEKHAKRLLDYDCRIIIRPADLPEGSGREDVIRNLAHLHLPTETAGMTLDEASSFKDIEPTPSDQHSPLVRILQRASKWKAVANAVVADPASYAPKITLEIDVAINSHKPEPGTSDEILLERAFWDCSSVHLTQLQGGLSGDKVFVYRAFPELELPVHGKNSPPLPYLVKIGPRKDIQTEFFKYVLSVRQSISFHLAPHLDIDRCCLGADRGILVGAFVEESESLLDRARTGRNGPAIIASLFNRTLGGWHRTKTKDAKTERSIAEELLIFLGSFPTKPPPKRLKLAKELGATLTHSKIRNLFLRCKSNPVWLAPIHGDLHAKNVLVRTTDAVVIDFFKHGRGPLLYDPASLEAGLLVDGFEGDSRSDSDWLKSIESLYDGPLYNAPTHCPPKNQSSWYFACVHQIRLHARHMDYDGNQYATALAIAFLKKAAKDLDFGGLERYRAAAYVLAERVLLNAQRKSGS